MTGHSRYCCQLFCHLMLQLRASSIIGILSSPSPFPTQTDSNVFIQTSKDRSLGVVNVSSLPSTAPLSPGLKGHCPVPQYLQSCLLVMGEMRYFFFFLDCTHTHVHIYLDFIYLFLDKGEGGEKERERNINVWLPLTHPPGPQPRHVL